MNNDNRNKEVKQLLVGANSAESNPYANLILSYLPEGASITSCGSDGVISFNYCNATYIGKCNENGMPIGKWKRKEGEKTELVEFYENYTQDNKQYTNVFVVQVNSFFKLFVNPKVVLGTYTFSNGAKYEGEWKDGKVHGEGTYTFLDGAKYEGEWKDGKGHGEGIYTDIDGYSYFIENIENHGSVFTTTSSSEERRKYLNDLVNQNESGVVKYKRYEDAKKAYEELKQGKIQNLNQTLNSSHASQNNLQLQQRQASDNAKGKGEPSLLQNGRLGLSDTEMLNQSDIEIQMDPLGATDNSTKQNKYLAQSQSNQKLLQQSPFGQR